MDTRSGPTSASPSGPSGVPWYGTYHGVEGARTFLAWLGEHARTQAFTVTTLIAENDTVLASGRLKHLIARTNRIFESDWALLCRIQGGKIVSYQFFENSAAARAAFQP